MKYEILVVDDEPANLRIIERLFRNDYVVLTAASGSVALKKLEQYDVALIISDQRMPEMTGIEFLKKAALIRQHTVRIILTGYTDIGDLVEAINCGIIYKYITKPWVNDDLRQTVVRALDHYEVTKRQHLLGLENARLVARIAQTVQGFVNAVGAIASHKMPGFADHTKRTTEYARAIGRSLGMHPAELEQLTFAASLHEVVHLNFPSDLEVFNAKLTPEQFRLNRDFYEKGLGLIEAVPELDDIATTIRYQHEHFDGSGFFDGLDEEKIPLASRILAVANAFDEINAGLKPNPLGASTAPIEWLRERAGREFDPVVVEACASIEYQFPDAKPSDDRTYIPRENGYQFAA